MSATYGLEVVLKIDVFFVRVRSEVCAGAPGVKESATVYG